MLTGQGFALISLRDMEVRSQEPEARMARDRSRRKRAKFCSGVVSENKILLWGEYRSHVQGAVAHLPAGVAESLFSNLNWVPVHS